MHHSLNACPLAMIPALNDLQSLLLLKNYLNPCVDSKENGAAGTDRSNGVYRLFEAINKG